MSLRALSLALLAAVPLLGGAQAQAPLDVGSLSALTGNTSVGCLTGLAGLVSQDPGQCLGINDALALFGPLLQAPASSVVAPLDSYLARDFCGKAACPESFFASARGVLDGACAQDVPQNRGLNIANAVKFTVDNYAQIRSGLCLQDASSGKYCLTEMLSTLQDVIGRNISVSTVMSALMNSTAQQELLSSLEAGKERLCTDCSHALYTEFSSLALAAGNLTAGMPMGMPQGNLTAGMPQGNMTAGMPQGNMTAGMPMGNLTAPAVMPQGNLTAGAPMANLTAGMPMGNLTAGMPMGNLTAGMPMGNLTAGAPMGNLTAGMPQGSGLTLVADEVSQTCGAGFLDGKIPSSVRNGTSEALASNNGTIDQAQTTPSNASSAGSTISSTSNRSSNPDGARSLAAASSAAAGAALLAAAVATLL